MPQLDSTTYLPQLFWLAVTFAVLYWVMARSALPRVSEVLEERQNRIDSDLEQAENYRKESERLEADYERLTAEAKAKALAHLKEEREKVDAELAQKQGEFTKKLDARVAEAEANIEKARKQAMDGIGDIAAEACASIVAKFSGQTLAKTAAKKAVKSSLGAK